MIHVFFFKWIMEGIKSLWYLDSTGYVKDHFQKLPLFQYAIIKFFETVWLKICHLKNAESKYIDLTTILGVSGTKNFEYYCCKSADNMSAKYYEGCTECIVSLLFLAKLYVLHMVINFSMLTHISWFPNCVPHATCPQQTRRHEENLTSIIRFWFQGDLRICRN